MKQLIKPAIIFLLGAAAGAGTTYKFFKTRYERRADEEIESVYAQLRKSNLEKEKAREETKEQAKEFETERKTYHKIIKDHGLKFYEVDTTPEDEKNAMDDYPRDDSPEVENRFSSIKLYLIDSEQYDTEAIHYDKQMLQYFTVDGVFINDDDENVTELFLPYISDGTLDGILSDPSKDFYMRSDSTQTDYYISQIESAYDPEFEVSGTP